MSHDIIERKELDYYNKEEHGYVRGRRDELAKTKPVSDIFGPQFFGTFGLRIYGLIMHDLRIKVSSTSFYVLRFRNEVQTCSFISYQGLCKGSVGGSSTLTHAYPATK